MLQCSTGQDRTGQDRTGQDRTGQDRTGQDRTGQDRTGQDRTGQDRTGQDRTGRIVRFGKSYADIWKLKENFYLDNECLLKDRRKLGEFYKEQPACKNCRICGEPFYDGVCFKSHGIEYYLCPVCGHLNGKYEETDDFCKKIYTEDDYGATYRNEGNTFFERVNSVYLPKADFLVDALNLRHKSEEINKMSFLDVGAGSGYFVAAMQKLGLTARGIEISSNQVGYGRQCVTGISLLCVDSQDVIDIVSSCSEQVVTFIGVLEHLTELQSILEGISKNKNIQYVFFSVPMFSYSALIESVFPDVFNRQLGGAHTHLFTNESLEWLSNRYCWEIVGRWYFGTDIADLTRSIMVQNEINGNSEINNLFKDKIVRIMDSLQLIMDKERFCSEVHMLVRKMV